MFIKQITIEGVEGDVEMRWTETGATITANDVELEISDTISRDELYAITRNVAKVIYGTTRSGRHNATNSMVHDVMREIERVARC